MTATPAEARRILAELAGKLAEQPVLYLPPGPQRALWIARQLQAGRKPLDVQAQLDEWIAQDKGRE